MKQVLQNLSHLPNHKKLFEYLVAYFKNRPEITGAFLGGSGAVGNMDRFSDLDFGFVCSSAETREKIFEERFEWPLQGWFHRMDADHIKPHFIIYLFEPEIHVDLVFYSPEDLPTAAGAPYSILWDQTGKLEAWSHQVNAETSPKPDWSNVVHEDERFWTWIHFAWGHIARGELYDISSQLEFFRAIPHAWQARLDGRAYFSARRFEQRGGKEFVEKMRRTYSGPELSTLKTALLALIEIHNLQRASLDASLKPQWKTTSIAREKITQLVKEL